MNGSGGSDRSGFQGSAPSEVQWIFFATKAPKPSSLRRALPMRLAGQDPVVVVNTPFSVLKHRRLPAFSSRVQRLESFPAAWLYTPLYFPERLPVAGAFAGALNRHLLLRELNALLGPVRGRRNVLFDMPVQCSLLNRLQATQQAYLAIDDHTVTLEGDVIPGELELERRLLAGVDHVVCVSETLAGRLLMRMRQSVPIAVLGNGYDEYLFDPDRDWPEPEELAAIPRPRILVAGHLSGRLDWEGIRAASCLLPEWQWVFLGGLSPDLDGEVKAWLQPGSGMPWHVLAPVALQRVPAFMRHCQAGGVPYRLNAFTMASDPLKGVEYLAMGLPVLATRVPSLRRFEGHIAWVGEGSGEDYVRVLATMRGEGMRLAQGRR
ncbi:MAG: hypothetical protein HQM02_07925 [Magnetococcales bacterium]|nr:hypothetical protein [Magnetococcales bacterium]